MENSNSKKWLKPGSRQCLIRRGLVKSMGYTDANQKGKVNGALTLARDSQGCWNRPHNWPAVILSE